MVKGSATTEGGVYDVSVDWSGRLAVSAGSETHVTIWDPVSGSRKRKYSTNCAKATLRVDIDPSGMFVAGAGADRQVRLFDFLSGEALATLGGHSEAVTGLAFSPDLEHVASTSGDGCVFVWALPSRMSAVMKSRRTEICRNSSQSSHNPQSSDPRVEQPKIGLQRPGSGVFGVSGASVRSEGQRKPKISDLQRIEGGHAQQQETKDKKEKEQRSILQTLLDKTFNSISKKPDVEEIAQPASEEGDAGQEKPAAGQDKPAVKKAWVGNGTQGGEKVPESRVGTKEQNRADEIVIEDVDQSDVKAEEEGMEVAAEDVDASQFSVLRSAGVLASQGIASHGEQKANQDSSVEAGPTDRQASDEQISDDEESAKEVPPATPRTREEEDKVFIRSNYESLEKTTNIVDPRSSIRLSASVNHRLKEHLRSSGVDMHEQPKDNKSNTPAKPLPSTIDVELSTSSVPSVPLSPGFRWDRANKAHEKNMALAKEIETMRHRLQAMGMCGGQGYQGPPLPTPASTPSVHTPATSQAPSVLPSPAKPKREPTKASPTVNPGKPTAEFGSKAQVVPTEGGAAKQPGTEDHQQSLFARMRQVGVVRAAERSDTGVSTQAKEVYGAVAQSETTLAQERLRLREEARRKAEEDIEQQKMAEEEARKEKFRGAKEEADKIRARLKELEQRKKASKATANTPITPAKDGSPSNNSGHSEATANTTFTPAKDGSPSHNSGCSKPTDQPPAATGHSDESAGHAPADQREAEKENQEPETLTSPPSIPNETLSKRLEALAARKKSEVKTDHALKQFEQPTDVADSSSGEAKSATVEIKHTDSTGEETKGRCEASSKTEPSDPKIHVLGKREDSWRISRAEVVVLEEEAYDDDPFEDYEEVEDDGYCRNQHDGKIEVVSVPEEAKKYVAEEMDQGPHVEVQVQSRDADNHEAKGADGAEELQPESPSIVEISLVNPDSEATEPTAVHNNSPGGSNHIGGASSEIDNQDLKGQLNSSVQKVAVRLASAKLTDNSTELQALLATLQRTQDQIQSLLHQYSPAHAAGSDLAMGPARPETQEESLPADKGTQPSEARQHTQKSLDGTEGVGQVPGSEGVVHSTGSVVPPLPLSTCNKVEKSEQPLPSGSGHSSDLPPVLPKLVTYRSGTITPSPSVPQSARSSITGVTSPYPSFTGVTGSAAPSVADEEVQVLDVELVLERYSEKLLEMVAQKLTKTGVATEGKGLAVETRCLREAPLGSPSAD